MRPLIGIPPALDECGRWRAGRRYHYVDAAYAAAVEEAGGTAVYLPPQRDAGALACALDGLLVPGGGDFAPAAAYPDAVRFDPVPAAQLAFDAGLLAAALARGIPVLGICYGMQLLVHQRGGRLLYHLPTDLPGAAPHRLPEPDGRHALEIVPGSRLHALLGDVGASVNSLHHQGVAEPGEGLRVCARAGDGVVEAVEDPSRPFCLGVQWHPEKLERAHRLRLFGAFVAACRAARSCGGAGPDRLLPR
jgi:putative glutamine amidotransferase